MEHNVNSEQSHLVRYDVVLSSPAQSNTDKKKHISWAKQRIKDARARKSAIIKRAKENNTTPDEKLLKNIDSKIKLMQAFIENERKAIKIADNHAKDIEQYIATKRAVLASLKNTGKGSNAQVR